MNLLPAKALLRKIFPSAQLVRLERAVGPFVRRLAPADLRVLATVTGSDKWGGHWYAQHYQTHFAPLRHKALNILEIGVGGYDDPNKGGSSLRMWKTFFPRASVFAIDIVDKRALQEPRIKIYQGSQDDADFLKHVAAEIGRLDIIIDDGSHQNRHVLKTFEVLFPLLAEGGIYAVEDTQTSYWPSYGGTSEEFNSPQTIMGFFKGLVDCLNYEEFLKKDYRPSYYDMHIVSMHFYHNLIFIYKGQNKEGSIHKPALPES
jgi:hypothetical protein